MGGREGEGHHTAPLGPSEQLQLLGSPAGRLQSQPRSPSPGRPRGSPRTVCLTGAQGRDLSLSPPVPCLTGTPQGPQPGARGALVASRSKRTRRAAAARQDLLVRPHLVTGRTWARAPAAAHAAAVTGPAPPTPVPACLLPCAKPRLAPRRTRPLTRLGSFSCVSGVCSHQVTGVTSQEARVTPEQATAHRPSPPSPHPAPRLRACCRGSPRKWDPTGGGHRCSRSARCLQGSRCRGRGDALFSTEQCSAVDAPSSVSGPGSSRLRAAVRCCGCRPTAPGSRPGPTQHCLRGPQGELRALRVQELDTPGGVHPNSPLPHSAQAVGVG